jgi:hypothetical protein
VDTGNFNGTLRLDVINNGTIHDLTGNPFSGATFTAGQFFTVVKVQTFNSQASFDGWVLESNSTSNIGGTFNSTAKSFNLGDDAANRQYRSILSFATSALPNSAVITKVTLKIKKSDVVNGATFAMFSGLVVDFNNGPFGIANLQKNDFQAPPVAVFGPFNNLIPANNWYTIDLTGASDYVNKLETLNGITQLRLRFKLGDNYNSIANTMKFFSGDAAAENQPQFIIEYYIP